MKYLSVCSGMEAASVAWEPLGWKPVAFSEIEPFPCAILKHRFPNTPNYGSLTEYQSWPVGPGTADLLVGGTPCQSFSVAGLRKGLEDPRGNLALVFLGLADKLKPRWIVWENVPGVLSSAGGRDFGSFLGALVELGYGFAYRVLDAQHFGVPQRRRRVFVVACLGDWRAPAEVLLEPDCVRRDPKKGRAKGQGPADGAEGGVDANGLQRTVGTLCADTHPGAYPGQDAYTGRLIPQAVSHWDGGPHPTLNQSNKANGSPGFSNQELFSQGGGGLVPAKPIAFKVRGGGNYSGKKGGDVKPDEKGGTGYLGYEDKTFTVATTQDKWVAAPIAFTQNQREELRLLGDVAGAVSASGGTHQTNYLAQPIPYRKSKRAQSTTDDESWVPAEASNTLNNFDLGDTRTTHAVVEPHIVQASELRIRGKISEQHTVPTPLAVHAVASQPGNLRRQAGADPSTETFPTLKCDSGDQSPHVANHPPMAVRRLTPVECERLQGFPDNWSRISWKGKPETECPDGPRYKACGNSMAVPVMSFIGRRIAEVDAKYSCNKTVA